MIKLVVTDLDGTLVNTFEANYKAYKYAFEHVNLTLSKDKYKKCFGLRFDDFMKKMNITDDIVKKLIHIVKTNVYKNFFDELSLNKDLCSFLYMCKTQNIKICLASTAKRENVEAILNYYGLNDLFNYIICGNDVKWPKPSSEIYILAQNKFGVNANEMLIFEDSNIGVSAALGVTSNVIQIKNFKSWY